MKLEIDLNIKGTVTLDGLSWPPVTPPTDSTRVTFEGSLWTLGEPADGGKLVLRDGQPVGGAGVEFKVEAGLLLLKNDRADWYKWTGAGWELHTPTDTGGPGNFALNPDLTVAQLLAPESSWRRRVDGLTVHPQSAAIIAAQAIVYPPTGHRFKNDWGPDEGIPYSAGTGNPAVPITALYDGESDPGPHAIALGAPIEPGSDKHLLHIDQTTGRLIELGMARRQGAGFWCEACAVFPLPIKDDARPLGWTSADAAGLPVLAGLVRFDEMERALAEPDTANQHLGHALRFTLPNTGHGFIAPARHYASPIPYGLPNRPPLGMRIRIKSTMDLSAFNVPTQVLLRTLQLFGAILADNGSAFFVTGTHDSRWGKHWDAITGNVDGKAGFKQFGGQSFLDNVEAIAWDDGDVVTQV